MAVSVSQVAAPFAGRYTLTHTRHTYDPQDGYRTHFIVSGGRTGRSWASSRGRPPARRGAVGAVPAGRDPAPPPAWSWGS